MIKCTVRGGYFLCFLLTVLKYAVNTFCSQHCLQRQLRLNYQFMFDLEIWFHRLHHKTQHKISSQTVKKQFTFGLLITTTCTVGRVDFPIKSHIYWIFFRIAETFIAVNVAESQKASK